MIPVGASGTCEQLYCLTLAWDEIPEWISIAGGSDEILLEPVCAVLIKSSIGWVLLDTGTDARRFRGPDADRELYAPGGLPVFPTDGDPLLDALAAHGLTPADIVLAAVSHLHFDHSGGLRHLAGAGVEVCVQRRELEFAMTAAGREDAYLRDDYDLGGLTWRVLDGDAVLAPGIEAVSTPGHTPGHMSYRVRMAQTGTWLFAMDAIDLQAGIDLDRVVGTHALPEDAPLVRTSHDRLTALAAAEDARLIAGHCPVSWPTVDGAEGHR
ncbi:MBL fold metallo-hydrolase [Rathayibacter tritici]|uniref:N-acyl homoserine lactonase family protein n=1 Tax=Rathayibacter tritici TaxID=33888 RepID=UPI000CE8E5B2|nr:N-acyl homoserine lactonase family protein [Rathayibacter tritici]PPF29452.1 MBL fold metallo-hydrolase [Rathayibacter tritici]PPI19477.1 MBL fold metallo-hydrolase [Rathayibacter tritici]